MRDLFQELELFEDRISNVKSSSIVHIIWEITTVLGALCQEQGLRPNIYKSQYHSLILEKKWQAL